ncbi:alpha/beta hydrolase family protein (plasmid) [Aquicoccus sp. G2-2]|uniref:alpha/beta hydrolase family protein n=1 Tax=Aquicoccus sp. G2-2 TaxID=3092120 RepID=UPI002ADF9FD7|nr:alpha/beta hydrolase family protein [Aquicoccus sp. G2-2]MEA1112116.1 alpha/beta hydrolase family protein [Aquicoccus sp. G2-2]
MYHSWLDRWDERRAKRGDDVKKASDFVLDAGLAFAGAAPVVNIEAFCRLADRAAADPAYFDEPRECDFGFKRDNGWIKFPSRVSTDIEENNMVCARITESGSFDKALVVFHHWNASTRYRHIANFFSRRGIAVVEIAMPYHFERSRPGSQYADYMLSPNLGRTIQSVRQAVWDGRKLIWWLKSEGYGEVSVLGMSLGSWVAGLIAAHDTRVSKAALFLTAGSLADMVWTGRATRAIRTSLEPEIALTDLRRAWGLLDLENYASQLARADLELQIVLGKRDKVVLPELSERLIQKLKDAGAEPSVLEMNCGHYSLSMPPYILRAGRSVTYLLGSGH